MEGIAMKALRIPARIGHIFVLVVMALFIGQLTACGGEDSGIVIPVVQPFALKYSDSSVVYAARQAIIPNVPTVRGSPVQSYTVEPALPRGLSMDARTGVVSGTPLFRSDATLYKVTALNIAGSTVGRIQIEVSDFAGGSGPGNTALTSVEIYDPGSGRWLPAASMAEGRRAHTATLLPDGRLLVVAGQDASPIASSELFDISVNGAQAAAGTGP
jgi:hypothetical protein